MNLKDFENWSIHGCHLRQDSRCVDMEKGFWGINWQRILGSVTDHCIPSFKTSVKGTLGVRIGVMVKASLKA